MQINGSSELMNYEMLACKWLYDDEYIMMRM